MAKVHQQAPSLATRLTLAFIRAYQLCLSPLIGPRCRFYPSCSQYATSAFNTHGFIKGFTLSFRHILKCHPGHPGGIDEVPCPQHTTFNEKTK